MRLPDVRPRPPRRSLQESVVAVAGSAAAGDLAGAVAGLDELEAELDAAIDADLVTAARAARIQDGDRRGARADLGRRPPRRRRCDPEPTESSPRPTVDDGRRRDAGNENSGGNNNGNRTTTETGTGTGREREERLTYTPDGVSSAPACASSASAASLDSGATPAMRSVSTRTCRPCSMASKRRRAHAVVRGDADDVDVDDPVRVEQLGDGLAGIGRALEERVGGLALPLLDVVGDGRGVEARVVLRARGAAHAVRRPGVDEVGLARRRSGRRCRRRRRASRATRRSSAYSAACAAR